MLKDCLTYDQQQQLITIINSLLYDGNAQAKFAREYTTARALGDKQASQYLSGHLAWLLGD